jgi:riboflavin synthase
VFSGIVAHRGVVRSAKQRRGRWSRGAASLELEIDAPAIARELKRGDSVAINGVCLSATDVRRRRFSVEAVAETLARSTMGSLRRSDDVNLELPIRLADRLGGHLVQGHADAVAEALRVEPEYGGRRVWWGAGEESLRYLVPKGSVALDGVSLTVVEVGRTSFQVALIPLTLETTTLGRVEVGTRVNLEVDVIAKYVERLASGHSLGRAR